MTPWEMAAEVSISSWHGYSYVLRVFSLRNELPHEKSAGTWSWSVLDDRGVEVAKGGLERTNRAARKSAVEAMAGHADSRRNPQQALSLEASR